MSSRLKKFLPQSSQRKMLKSFRAPRASVLSVNSVVKTFVFWAGIAEWRSVQFDAPTSTFSDDIGVVNVQLLLLEQILPRG